jgi:glycogen operon protein
MDWSGVAKHSDILRFVRGLINFIQQRQVFLDEKLLATSPSEHHYLAWHGITLHGQTWKKDSHTLAFELYSPQGQEHLHIVFNAYWQTLTFEVPPLKYGKSWHLIVDTAKEAPHDFYYPEQAPVVYHFKYQVESRSCVVLMEL